MPLTEVACDSSVVTADDRPDGEGGGGECNILLAVHRTRRRALPEGDCNAATILLLPLPLVIARSPRNYNNVPASDSTTWGRLNLCGWVDEWMAGFEKEKMEVI